MERIEIDFHTDPTYIEEINVYTISAVVNARWRLWNALLFETKIVADLW